MGKAGKTEIASVHHGLTFVALVVLATGSLILGTAGLGAAWGLALGLGIGAAKAILVLAVFMHVAEQPFRTRLAIGFAVGLLLVLVALTVGDVATRQLLPRAPLPSPQEGFYRSH